VVLLIGLGIGATPLISIVRDVLNKIKRGRSIAKAKKRPFLTKRAYLHWVIREVGSLEWFQSVMDRVAKKDKNGVLELHIYCTSVYWEDGARHALIAMLQKLQREKKEVITFSRTSVLTHFGRPEWPDVFKRVAEENENQRVGMSSSNHFIETLGIRQLTSSSLT
jgi:respiratory burst oxidase